MDASSDLLYSCDVAGSLKKWNWRAAKDSFAEDSDVSQRAPVAVRQKAHSSDISGIALNPADPGRLFSCGKDDKIKVGVDAHSAAASAVIRFSILFAQLRSFCLVLYCVFILFILVPHCLPAALGHKPLAGQ